MLLRYASMYGAGSGGSASDIIVLGAGQSNIANWSKTTGGWNLEGETALLSTLNAANPTKTNAFIQGADGSTYLIKSAWAAAGSVTPNDFWVNDDAPGAFTAGQRLLDCFADITIASRTASQVTHVLWSQGEADASPIGAGTITSTQYLNGMIWLKDYFFTNCVNLREFLIRPLGRRSYGGATGDVTGYDVIRLVQQSLAASYPTQVTYGSETYDLEMFQETYTTDGVHRSGAAYTIEGTRAAREILKDRGLFSGNTKGAVIASITYASINTIVVTVTHDVGTALANRAGTAYSGTPINITPSASLTKPFRLFDSVGGELDISSVFITGANQITITTAGNMLQPNNVLRYGFNAMANIAVIIDRDAIAFDNATTNPLPLRASYSGTFNGSTTLPTTTASVERFDITLGTSDLTNTGSFSAIVSGASMLIGAGVSVPNDTADTKGLRGSSNMYNLTARITRGTIAASLPSITWKMQAVQLPSTLIDFAYTVPATIASGSTTSGAITLPIAVDPTRSFIWMEEDNDLQVNSNTSGSYTAYLEPLGAGTSVTLTSPLNSVGTIRASVQVVQLKAAAVRLIQEFSIDIPTSATSGTTTLASVTTTNAAIFPMGQSQQTGTLDSSPARRQARLDETSATVITATRNTSISTTTIRVRGVRVELNSGYWTVQKGTIANVSGTNAATALAVTNVLSAKTFILRMGYTTTSTTVGSEGEYTAFLYPTVVANNITLLNMTRGSTAANVITYGWQLVTFA